MSARDELIQRLAGFDYSHDTSRRLSARAAAEMLDAYAHELAEEIRNSEKLRDYTDDHMSDCNMAADLIDPEVE